MSSRPSRFYDLPRLEGEDRDKALRDAGPTWREYATRELLRWWYAVAVLIVDAWILSAFIRPLDLFVMIPSLAGATYLELLGWRYLWYEPRADEIPGEGFLHSRWFYPVPLGRWSKAAARRRSGLPPEPKTPVDRGAEEFL